MTQTPQEVFAEAGIDMKALLMAVAKSESPTLLATAVIGLMCAVVDERARAAVSPSVLRNFADELEGVAVRMHGGGRA
jgi:hypothetical protein